MPGAGRRGGSYRVAAPVAYECGTVSRQGLRRCDLEELSIPVDRGVSGDLRSGVLTAV